MRSWHALTPTLYPSPGAPQQCGGDVSRHPSAERPGRPTSGWLSRRRYTEMHVIEITRSMLCSYLPRGWESAGPRHPHPPSTCRGLHPTAVTLRPPQLAAGEHPANHQANNPGIDEATWMKRLAGGSGERAGPENWGQCPGTPVPGSQVPGFPEISGSVVFWEWEGVRSRLSDHKARDHSQEPESQGHRV